MADQTSNHGAIKETASQQKPRSLASNDPEHGEKVVEADDFPEGGARAWAVASAAGGILFCTMGYINAFGLYQEYYESHQLHDQSPSTISWIGSLQSFFLFGGALVGGPLFDRYGAKVSCNIFIL